MHVSDEEYGHHVYGHGQRCSLKVNFLPITIASIIQGRLEINQIMNFCK